MYHLLAEDTIDTVIEETVSSRLGILTKIVDGKDLDDSESALTKLKALRGKK